MIIDPKPLNQFFYVTQGWTFCSFFCCSSLFTFCWLLSVHHMLLFVTDFLPVDLLLSTHCWLRFLRRSFITASYFSFLKMISNWFFFTFIVFGNQRYIYGLSEWRIFFKDQHIHTIKFCFQLLLFERRFSI